MTLRECLAHILKNYVEESQKPSKDNPLANFIRNDFRETIQEFLTSKQYSFTLKGSSGNTNWAAVPWLGIFHPKITKGAEAGVYPVFLFRADGTGVYLSLNQGTTQLKKTYGSAYQERAKSIGKEIRDAYPQLNDWLTDDLDLHVVSTSIGKTYEATNIAAKLYTIDALPSNEELLADVDAFSKIYNDLGSNWEAKYRSNIQSTPQKVWRCIIDVKYSSYSEFKKRKVFAQGWQDIGDLTKFLSSRKALEDQLKAKTVNHTDEFNKILSTFDNLIFEIKPGDLVVAVEGTKIKGICQIPDQSPYAFDASYAYSHERGNINWQDIGQIPTHIVINEYRPPGPLFQEQKYKKEMIELWNYMMSKKDPKEMSQLPMSFQSALTISNIKLSPTLSLRFIAALISKPFIILTGLSGSGKTKLAEAFSLWISESSEQYKLIAVGADWTNREPLLGYPDALNKGQYLSPDNGALEFILTAAINPDKPYFLILDEMNMSHVERYFADFLSAMESTERIINLHSVLGDWSKCKVPSKVVLPKNLFIIGTVNIDETTYMFSPKVLDRANVIEFRVSKDEMASFLGEKTISINMEELRGKGATFGSEFVKRALKPNMGPANLKTTLLPFFEKLQNIGAEFGYRTTTEISCFVSICNEIAGDGMGDDAIIDAAIMQKLLPKVHGSRNKIQKTLGTLGKLCLVDGETEPFQVTSGTVKYPLSYEKLTRMHERVVANGFTSYAEA